METTVKSTIRKAGASLLLFGLVACADLDVANPNAPDARRALATAGDVESLIAGSFQQWWNTIQEDAGPSPILANQSFMWSAWPANFGMVFYSSFPRPEVVNSATDGFYGNMLDYGWSLNYRALSAVSQGFQSLDDPEIAEELGEERVLRARAYGRFVQGLAHGSLALLYDEAFIIDETFDPEAPPPAVSYQEAMNAALGFFDDAIDLATGASFTIPAEWMSVAVSADELVEIAHSMKARYRANVARTPAEREAVDWNAVIADVDAGVGEDGWWMETGYFTPWDHEIAGYMSQPTIGWAQASYMIFGMADQSGKYQEWLSFPPAERHPDLPSGPFLIQTPDQRFPQGATLAEQRANPGMDHVLTGDPHMIIGHLDWRQPSRGTYRWSYYRSAHMDYVRVQAVDVPTPEITPTEMRLLKAEGLLRNGDAAGAAALINVSREAAGLNATDAAATNTSCVPKLPDSSCGDLMEMLKWEKRLETMVWGVHSVSWFFDGRGWGDLYAGTALTLPVPCQERELLIQECNTYGGSPAEPGSSPGSVYAWPHEG